MLFFSAEFKGACVCLWDLELFLFLVEIMTHAAWRQSCLPPTHVIGVGCNLESERLSYTLNVALLANSTNKKAWVIGEQSDNKGELRLFCNDDHAFK